MAFLIYWKVSDVELTFKMNLGETSPLLLKYDDLQVESNERINIVMVS